MTHQIVVQQIASGQDPIIGDSESFPNALLHVLEFAENGPGWRLEPLRAVPLVLARHGVVQAWAVTQLQFDRDVRIAIIGVRPTPQEAAA